MEELRRRRTETTDRARARPGLIGDLFTLRMSLLRRRRSEEPKRNAFVRDLESTIENLRQIRREIDRSGRG